MFKILISVVFGLNAFLAARGMIFYVNGSELEGGVSFMLSAAACAYSLTTLIKET